MAFDAGAIVARMKLDTSGFTAGVSAVKAASLNMSMAIRRSVNDARLVSQSVEGVADRMRSVGSVSALLGGVGLGAVSKSMLNAAASTERLNLAMSVLLRSPDEGRSMISWVDKYASSVVAKMGDMRQSALSLTAVFGSSGKEAVQSWLPVVADISAMFNMSIQETTAGLIRMLSGGAAAADLFRERGILQAFGFKPGEQAGPEETKRRVMENYLAVDSTLRGMASKLSTTWDGVLSMIVDKWEMTSIAVMNSGPFEQMKKALVSVDEYWNQHFDEIVRTTSQYAPAAMKIAAVTAALVALKGAAMLAAYGLGSALAAANLLAMRAPIIAASIGVLEFRFGAAQLAGVAMWTKVYIGAGLFLGAVVSVISSVELLRQRWDGVKQGLKEVWGIATEFSDWFGEASAKNAEKDSMFGWVDTLFGGKDETRQGLPSFDKKRQILEAQLKAAKDEGDLISAWKNFDAEMAKPGEAGRIVDDIRARLKGDAASVLPDMTAEIAKQQKELEKVFTDSKSMDALKVSGDGGIGGALKKQSEIAIDSLDDMAKAGETLKTSLDPVRALMAETVLNMAQLELAGHDDAATMGELAAKVWETAQSLTAAQFGTLETQLRNAGAGGAVLADELQRMADQAANVQKLADAEEEWRITLADMRNTPDVVGKNSRVYEDVRETIMGIGQSLSDIGGSMNSKTLQAIGAVTTGIMSVVMAYVSMSIAATAAAGTAAAAWMAILGPIALVLAAVTAVISIFGVFGSTTKEATSGMAKVMDELKAKVDDWADSLTDKIVEFTKTGKASFKEFADSVIEDALRIIVRYALIQPAIEFFENANGNVFSGGAVVPFAAGGVVSGPTLFPMKSGVGLMGEAGPEAIMPLKRGRDGKLGVSGSGTVVNVIDQRTGGSPVTVTESAGPNGKQVLTVMIRDAVTDLIQGGHMDGVLRSNFRLARRPI